MQNHLKAVDEDYQLGSDLAEAIADASSDLKLDTLEDVHLKEVAFCKQAIVNTRRATKTECSAIDGQIAALQQRKLATQASGKAEIGKLERRAAAATAYLVTMQVEA